jgi:hypothetical protein
MILAIVDHLHGDKLSLKASSLVCKAWTHPARLHLFAKSTVTWPLQPAAFPFVRHLHILMDMRQCNSGPTWDEIILQLVGFHRIVSLTVDLSGQSPNAQTWSALGKNFPTVVSLYLGGFGCSQASSLVRLICSFPSLRKLFVCGVFRLTSTESALASATTLRLSPDLDTLELGIAGVDTIMEWLLSLPVRPAIRTVRLQGAQPADLTILHKFIGAFGNGLEMLTLSAYTDGVLPYLI